MANGTFGGGNGTTTSPYLIEDAKDFIAIRNRLSAHYRQTQDIDFEGETYTPTSTFTGSYEGNGYKIKNIKISSHTEIPSLVSSYTFVGLFGAISTPSVIQNIHVVNAEYNIPSVNKTVVAGGIVGYLNGTFATSPISNCSFQGSIDLASGSNYAPYSGGIAGFAYNDENMFSNCFVNATLKSPGSIGGICFYGKSTNCHFTGTIAASRSVFGITHNDCVDCTVTDSSLSTGESLCGICNRSATRCSVSKTSMYNRNNLYGISTGNTTNCTLIDSTLRSDSNNTSHCAVGMCKASSGSIKGCLVKNCTITGPNAAGIHYGDDYRPPSITDCAVMGGMIINTHSSCCAGGITVYNASANYYAQAINRCYCSANVVSVGTDVGGISATKTVNQEIYNSFFLGDYVKGLGARTVNVGLICNKPTPNLSNNYSLDTSQIILE